MNEKIHSITMNSREYLNVTAVEDIVSFDESMISLLTKGSVLNISGQSLSIKNLSLENGEVTVTGSISALVYFDDTPAKKGFFGRLKG